MGSPLCRPAGALNPSGAFSHGSRRGLFVCRRYAACPKGAIYNSQGWSERYASVAPGTRAPENSKPQRGELLIRACCVKISSPRWGFENLMCRISRGCARCARSTPGYYRLPPWGKERPAESEPRASASGGMQISLTTDWDFGADDWARVQNSGVSIEAMCVELG